ncbi:MAG: allantoinase AllB, partial [Chthoniobacterales bacterium]
MPDLIIRNANVPGAATADIAVENGIIVEMAPAIAGTANDEMDATGLLVLPGVFDAHVHFNEPGRVHWEGFATGSRALAAGGGTSFVDMPLNASPPTIDRESFEQKRVAGEAASVLDFALWGGLVPGNSDRLEELAECGVVGFKAFMIDSGIADFPGVDASVLREGMKIAARLGLPVAVHAEDEAMIAEKSNAARQFGNTGVRGYLDSRPPESELNAVRVALEIAGETRCRLQIVHVSCPEAIELISSAKAGGVDVTSEVCPHHLLLNEDAMFRHGAFAKCAPPLRNESRRAALWDDLPRIDSIGSDHSPAPPDMKQGDDMFKVWGGIMGCQHGFLLLLDAVLERNSGRLPDVWEKMTSHPARRLGLGTRKGRIAPGFDADIIFVERTERREITAAELLYKHKTSPYVGAAIQSRVVRSLLRGHDVGLSGATGCFLPRQ